MNIVMNTPKYRDIFNKGKELFWKYGIKRVTIEEICKEAGVSKMTFYKFFPNKIALVKAILDEVFEGSIEEVNQLILSDIPFSNKLEKIFQLKIEGTKNISMELINDLYSNPELGLVNYMAGLQEKSMDVIVNFYKDAQDKGYIRKDIKIDFILAYSFQVIKLMEDENLVSKYDEPQDLIIEAMNFMFYGLLPRE
ncbi:MAG: TetR/AcrR family transcriptional regulator [Bacteroidales bacterium]|nr:TetR/AcrR family transcriptional regulator [Bacteroidales bacterium]